jgi:hypothetical protein
MSIRICIHVYKCTSIYGYIYMRMCVYIYILTHIRIYIRICTYEHTKMLHTRTQVKTLRPFTMVNICFFCSYTYSVEDAVAVNYGEFFFGSYTHTGEDAVATYYGNSTCDLGVPLGAYHWWL